MNSRKQAAFTLMEIMVALAIIAITMGAIIENSTASNRNAQYLRDKTVANWVAMNQIALIRAQREWSSRLDKQGREEMAGREWIWKMKISRTDEANLRRLEVTVFADEDDEQALVTRTGFMGRL
ncbi:MAG: type II secretion system minor pseudopilin GspI [Gammaproteobacteria bacterium]|nr:type II secretion system minor pseudopilin GspI [Gammaproteobacteria bacterium]